MIVNDPIATHVARPASISRRLLHRLLSLIRRVSRQDSVDAQRERQMLASWRQMRWLEERTIPAGVGEIRLFAVMRDECLRLPYFLRYYTNLGVDRFFVVDNGSTDGTTDILQQCPNVHVLRTDESFTQKQFWMNLLLRRFGRGRWCIVADADELLVYPHMYQLPLHEFVRFLDDTGVTALHAAFLDLYAREPTAALNYRPGDDPLAICRYFDPAPFRHVAYDHAGSRTTQNYLLADGVRRRLFGIETCCSKMPLLKCDNQMFVKSGQHSVENAVIGDLQAAMLHIMFLQDFCAKANRDAARGVHWDGARVYRVYKAYLDGHGGDVAPWTPESVEYGGGRPTPGAGDHAEYCRARGARSACHRALTLIVMRGGWFNPSRPL